MVRSVEEVEGQGSRVHMNVSAGRIRNVSRCSTGVTGEASDSNGIWRRRSDYCLHASWLVAGHIYSWSSSVIYSSGRHMRHHKSTADHDTNLRKF